MSISIEKLVREIHTSQSRFVIGVSGGGSRSIAELLEVPGASRTVLEIVIPYSRMAMTDWLGGEPDHFCSAPTTRAMAMVGYHRACQLDETASPKAGIACTAGLATDRPRRGPHRAHVALQTASLTTTRSLEFQKGARERLEEERLVSGIILNTVAESCGISSGVELELLPGERIEESRAVAPPEWQELLAGRAHIVQHGGNTQSVEQATRAVFPGAFNPVHIGHRRMIEIAQQVLEMPVALEISIENVDKPPLDFLQIQNCTRQFGPDQVVWLTRAAKFEQKARLFPGTTFVVGIDTLRRIGDPRYYANNVAACDAALQEIAAAGCQFLVFGRDSGDGFCSLASLDLPKTLESVCREVPPDVFREDVSSTAIRRLYDQ